MTANDDLKRELMTQELEDIGRRLGCPIAMSPDYPDSDGISCKGNPTVTLHYGNVWVATSHNFVFNNNPMLALLGPICWVGRKAKKETLRDDELVIGDERYPAHAVDVKRIPRSLSQRIWWWIRRRSQITYPEIALGATIDDRTVVLIGPPDEIKGLRLEWLTE